MRKSKFDELPQLWNVLRGEMSLVGPRPEVPKWTEIYPDRWRKVLTVRPGITDPASIAFRDEESLLAAAPDPERVYREVILPRKLSMYESYVSERSMTRDAIVLAKTLWAILAPRPKA
jgi:lipopolysaccharide/colanic/teichoic acid biosynthesis glycosyltransferase